mgnify:FL=1
MPCTENLIQEGNADPDRTLKPDFFIFVCEYEVNLSTNEKVITEKQTLTQIVKEQCWWKGLDLSNIVCEYEVNPLTNEKVITEIQNFKVVKEQG